MRIESVKAYLAHTFMIVKVTSDSGLCGWGQCAYFSAPEASAAIVKRFARYLEGKDPLEIERHWYTLFRSSPFRGADRMGALSAVDIALWDLAGKHFQMPVYQLLGGRQRDRVRLHYLMAGSSSQPTDKLVELAKFAAGEGFTALKLDPLPPDHQLLSRSQLIDESVNRMAAVRETVGWEMDIGVEIHRKLVPGDAIMLAAELEKFRPLFYEDSIQPNSMDAHAQVERKVRLPIAIGERHHTVHEFRDLLARDSIHYVRPDVGLAGGITHTKKIATLAESFHAGVVLHNFLGPLLTAASVQVVTAIPNNTTLEYCMWDEEVPNSELLTKRVTRQGGYVIPPDEPGLGIILNEEFLEKYPFREGTPGATLDNSGAVAAQ